MSLGNYGFRIRIVPQAIFLDDDRGHIRIAISTQVIARVIHADVLADDAATFFSLPFVFGAAREANPGRRVTLGAIVGISYYYFDQALGYMGLLLGIHAAFTTLLPIAIIVLLAFWLLFRVP